MPTIIGNRESKGSTEAALKPQEAKILQALSKSGKVSAEDATYTEGGPMPFTCGNCRHYDERICDIVEGPGLGGQVDKDATCRFWSPAPALVRGKSDV